MKLTQIDVTGLVCALLTTLFLCQLSGPVRAAPGSEPASRQSSTFAKNAPMPAWALPLAAISETTRTDPLVYRLIEYQVQLGAETGMLANLALQVNERAALSRIGQYSIVYYPIYQKLKLHRIALIRAGHVIDKMDSVKIRHLERETSMEAGMYGGATTVELLLDDVRVGDTLWLTYGVTGENPVFDRKWHSLFYWDNVDPIELRRITVTYPASRKLVWGQLSDFNKAPIPTRVEDLNGQHRIQFEDHGIDAVSFEPATPSDYFPVRLLEFSEFPDWHAVASWADSLFPKVKPGPLQTALFKDFSHESTAATRAAAALHWVQNEVRYFSVSIGENSHRPQLPEVVIKRRYGDCKDKSYLLVSLLQQMGIKAMPVLIAAHSPKIPAKVMATPDWFDHVIVRLEIDGRTYYVDPTLSGQESPLETLPTAMPGASGLLVEAGTTALTTLPERADVGPDYEHEDNIKIEKFDGDAVLNLHDTYRGFYSDWARTHFINLSEHELKKEILSYYEKEYPGITLEGLPQFQNDSKQNQFHVRARFSLPAPVRHEDKLYKLSFDSQILKGNLRIPDKLVRNFPFEIAGGKRQSRYRLNIEWPAIVRADLPSVTESIDNDYFSVKEDTLLRGNQTAYQMDFRIKNDIVPAADMTTLHTQTKLLDKFFNPSFRINENQLGKADSLALSYRSMDAARIVGLLSQKQQEIVRMINDKKGINDDMCNLGIYLIDYEDAVSSAQLFDQFLGTFRNNFNSRSDAEKRCLTKLFYDRAWFADSISVSGTTKAIADKDHLMMNLAWARFYTDDSDAAITTMDSYVHANQAARGWMPILDLASQIALYQRTGKDFPPDLIQSVTADQDSIWPRPILAMQLKKITPDELVKITASMQADARDISEAEAWFYIGQTYLAEKKYRDAERAFKWVLARGNRNADFYTQAKYELTRISDQDPETKAGLNAYQTRDYVKANTVWEKNAQSGSANSQLYLGNAYDNGTGVEQDSSKAMYWYRLAADQGNEAAQYDLGLMYINGRGVEVDPGQGLAWIKKSAELGFALAQNLMGNKYKRGDGVEINLSESIRWFKLAADQNNQDAQASLCVAYMEGNGVATNYGASLVWALLGTAKDDPAALTNLGILFERGWGVEKNMKTALQLYQMAADKNNVVAQTNLALAYRFGRGVPADNKLALHWYQVAVEHGSSDAQFNLGYLYLTGSLGTKDDLEGIRLVTLAATQGNMAAQNELGWMYLVGRHVKEDHKEALKWLRLAAGQGSPNALTSLGWMYQKPVDIAQDYNEAVRLYRLAAAQGFAQAQINLAWMYHGGLGVPKDDRGFRKWLSMAAKQGNATAQYQLGQMYHSGHGVPVDQPEAARWYLLAAQQGHAAAQNNIGWAYYTGTGVTQDFTEALKWFHLAIDQNESEAKDSLAEAYRDGKGVAQDINEALKWFRRSADQNNPNAQNYLGDLYFEGLGVPQDYAEAIKWYRLAADQDQPDAQKKLADMYRSGKGVQADEKESEKWLALAAGQEKKQDNKNVAHAEPDSIQSGKATMQCPDNANSPNYPTQAAQAYQQGVVGLALYIGADGYVLDSKIEKSSGFKALDEAALSALDACTFSAQQPKDNPLPFWIASEYVWKLPG
ncbi:TonB family protein [Oxalobacteraceae bacterium GrIS 2.11]